MNSKIWHTGLAAPPDRSARPDPWIRTSSPEEAIHLCDTSFYPHRLTLLGSTSGFGFAQRVTQVGPITAGDVTYETDVRLDFDDVRAGYHVAVPLTGGLESRHRGREMTASAASASMYQPDGATTVTRWPGGSRLLVVKIDQAAVDTALERLIGRAVTTPVPFAPTLPLAGETARSWVRLLMEVHRADGPGSLLRHTLVSTPLVASLIHGLLLLADHPYREALTAPAPAPRPAAVRHAIEIIEASPELPLTTSVLAARCHVSARTLQEAFHRHLGISPMTYLRKVRLARAHRDLRSADPFDITVASIAHRWGFTHLGRFAAAHKAAYGETPAQALRAAR